MFFEKSGRIAAAFGLALYCLSGCSEIPATGEMSFTGFMNTEDEKRVGKRENDTLVATYGGIFNNPALTNYIKEIGYTVVKNTEEPDIKYKFTILNSLTVNAFALPGGYVYVTRGLLSLLSDEGELAGVLAHEIAHVTARHSSRRYSATTASNITFVVLTIFTAGISEFVERGMKLVLQSYSRDQELQADDLAIRYLRNSGYDPHGLVRVIDKMHRYEDLLGGIAVTKAKGEDDWSATHPPSDQRIEDMINTIAGEEDNPTKTNAARYLKRINGLPLFARNLVGAARVRVIWVDKEMTMRELIGDSPFEEHLRWLEVINGLEEDQVIASGKRIKIVKFDGKVPRR